MTAEAPHLPGWLGDTRRAQAESIWRRARRGLNGPGYPLTPCTAGRIVASSQARSP